MKRTAQFDGGFRFIYDDIVFELSIFEVVQGCLSHFVLVDLDISKVFIFYLLFAISS